MQIYPQGSGDSDGLEAEAGDADALEAEVAHTEPQALSRSLGRTKSLDPRSYMLRGDSEGRVHYKQYPTSAQLLSKADLQRVKFPRHNVPVTSAPVWCDETIEGQIRGGIPKVSSHPEGLSDLASMQAAAEPMASPFARYSSNHVPQSSTYACLTVWQLVLLCCCVTAFDSPLCERKLCIDCHV